MKEKVFQWIQEGCNFNAGLNLLAEIGKNKQLPRIMAGHENRYAGKLLYELCKAAGFSLSEFQQIKESLQQIVEQLSCHLGDDLNSQAQDCDPPADDPPAGDPSADDSPIDNPPVSNSPEDNPPADETSGEKKLPESVEKVIKEHADLFKLRSQLHEQMGGLPEDNNDETVKKRKNLSDSIALISPRIDLMFAAKEAFYINGLLPDLAVLFPEPKAEAEPVQDKLPSDPDELKKIKKNLQSANTKDQNMLEYQDAKKGDKSNPMPPGPKRLKLETRINERNVQIEKIDFKLLSCS